MSFSFLRKEISTVQTMGELVPWRQKLFPHLKKNLTAVLMILKTLEGNLLCLWRSSKNSPRRKASESLQIKLKEWWSFCSWLQEENMSQVQENWTLHLWVSTVGQWEQKEEEEQGIWLWRQEEEEILKVFFQVFLKVFITQEELIWQGTCVCWQGNGFRGGVCFWGGGGGVLGGVRFRRRKSGYSIRCQVHLQHWRQWLHHRHRCKWQGLLCSYLLLHGTRCQGKQTHYSLSNI